MRARLKASLRESPVPSKSSAKASIWKRNSASISRSMRERRNAARNHDRSLLHNVILPPLYSDFDRGFMPAISAIIRTSAPPLDRLSSPAAQANSTPATQRGRAARPWRQTSPDREPLHQTAGWSSIASRQKRHQNR